MSNEMKPKAVEENSPQVELFTDLVGNSAEKALNIFNSKKLLDNVAIFIDYDNVYWTLSKLYNHDPNHKDPDKNLFHQLWNRYGQDHVRTFRVYADFQQVRTSLTSLQQNRVQIRHVYSNGKEGESRKNSSDIELCIDAIESTYKDPNITCYVFVTADSDMIPILSRMMYKGKRVELFYLSEAAPKYVDLKTYVHNSEDLKSFLSIESKDYDLESYVMPSLQFINEWHIKHGHSDLFLGTSWLKRHLSNKLGLPEKYTSELIEKMQIEELIYEGKKELNEGKQKNSIMISDKGQRLLNESVNEEVAASKEN